MKKRKSCTLSQSRPIKDTQSLTRVHTLNSSSKLSFANQSKRQIPTKSATAVQRSSSKPAGSSRVNRKKETYKSLESLFDLNKPIELQNFPFCYPPVEEEKTEVFFENSYSLHKFKELDDFDVASELNTAGDHSYQDNDHSQLLDSEFDSVSVKSQTESNLALFAVEEFSATLEKMADEEPPAEETPEATEEAERNLEEPEEEPPAEDAPPPPEEEAPEEPAEPAEPGDGEAPAPEEDGQGSDGKDSLKGSGKESSQKVPSDVKSDAKTPPAAEPARPISQRSSIYAPDYPLPVGTGLGVLPKCGQNRDSVLSCLPLAEDSVAEEMRLAEERACCVREEIQELKKILDDLFSKEDLSEGDTLILRDTQTAVMEKIGELNEITRKLQRTIGLCDPSTQTFAKMFELLPYPHIGVCAPKKKRKPCADPFKSGGDCTEGPIEPEATLCTEKFAFPVIDYPEDQLPRVIVCGTTEENFPKIVVADSRPKGCGDKCRNAISGKLEESLCMQDKLAKECAELEGGKYQLEAQIAQRDNVVESLQRKVCGLQAEMRIVVKENCELSKKIACLAQQRGTPSPPPRSNSPCCPSPPRPLPPNPCCKPPPPPPNPCCKPPPPQSNPCCKPPPPCPPNKEDDFKICYNPPPCKPPVDCSIPPPPRKCCFGQTGEGIRRLCGGGLPGDDKVYNDMYYQCEPTCPKSPPPSRRSRGGCEHDGLPDSHHDNRLSAFGENTQQIGEQLCCIEQEVRALQQELQCVQLERQQLEAQKRQLESQSPCCQSPKSRRKTKDITCSESMPEASNSMQQLCALREQYARLQDDYKSKLCETSRLRSEIENFKRDTREAKEALERVEIKLADVTERLRICDGEKACLLGAKEQLVEQEQALLVAKQRFRECQEELEELRSMIRDQAAQLDDYRNKYLMAQQQVEEQRRQMDLMEMDNARMNENVTLEIGRVKNQFQEKLAELAPLPEILKQTQMKLSEVTQMRMMAEHNCEELSRELLSAKEKIDGMCMQIQELQREIANLQDGTNDFSFKMEDLERKNGELRNENERLKTVLARLDDLQNQTQKKLDEKQHEIVQLQAMLEQVREDSARQVSRTKERCEAMKRSMQSQISDFEIQLASCRAAAKTAQKERDEIRQKMSGQIVNLNESLQQAQGRIRSLQGHVDYLKVSYSNVFTSPDGKDSRDCPTAVIHEVPSNINQGYDSCDCNY